MTTKYKGCIDYIVIFQIPQSEDIKSYVDSIIIEPVVNQGIQDWINRFRKQMSTNSYRGIYIDSFGLVHQENDFDSMDNLRIELF